MVSLTSEEPWTRLRLCAVVFLGLVFFALRLAVMVASIRWSRSAITTYALEVFRSVEESRFYKTIARVADHFRAIALSSVPRGPFSNGVESSSEQVSEVPQCPVRAAFRG